MEQIIPLVIQVISGVVGGGAVGGMLKNAAMGMLPKLLAGGLGGLGGAQVLGGLISGAMGGDPAGGMDLGNILGDVGGGLVGGGVLSGLAGTVMGMMKK